MFQPTLCTLVTNVSQPEIEKIWPDRTPDDATFRYSMFIVGHVFTPHHLTLVLSDGKRIDVRRGHVVSSQL